MVADHPPLSEGFFERALKGDQGATGEEQPVLQVMGWKPISAQERYRLYVSDGRHCNPFVMLATQLNHLVTNNVLQRNSIIKVNKHICNAMASTKPGDSGRKIVIFLDIEVLVDGNDIATIGNPIQMNTDGSFATPAPSAASASSDAPSSSNGASSNGHSAVAVKRPADPPRAMDEPRTKVVPRTPSGSSGVPPEFSNMAIVPINMLNPYTSNWAIRTRVVQKGELRHYKTAKGEGKLFSMTLADETGEIRMTCFNQDVDRIHGIVTAGNVYYVKGGKMKAADKKWNTTNADYEITAGFDTVMVPCDDDDSSIPKTSFNFTKIKDIADQRPDALIDVIGVVKSASDSVRFTAKTSQKEFSKREVVLVDDSKAEIRLTLWGETAENFDASDQPVLAIKGCKVSDFGGRSLSTMQSSILMKNPGDLREAHILRGWFDEGGKDEHMDSLSGGGQGGGAGGGGPAKDLTSVGMTKLPMLTDEPKYTGVIGTIVAFRETNTMYKSCGKIGSDGKDCRKKVQDNNDGTYSCPKCNTQNSNFVYRYILSGFVRDSTDGMWVTFFDDEAKQILGMAADDLGKLIDGEDPAAKDVFADAIFSTWNFRFRTKMETYNDEKRMKTQCVGIQKLDSAHEKLELLRAGLERLRLKVH